MDIVAGDQRQAMLVRHLLHFREQPPIVGTAMQFGQGVAAVGKYFVISM